MVFAVNFCEACHIKLIRLRIAQSIMPCVSTASADLFQGEDEVLGNDACRDVLPSLIPIIVDVNLVVAGGDEVERFIRKFKQLCKVWMVYVLSRKKFCPLVESIADRCPSDGQNDVTFTTRDMCHNLICPCWSSITSC